MATPQCAIRDPFLAVGEPYLARVGADRSANTAPGNTAGGLSIVKSGFAPITAVLAPGEKLTRRGLVLAATPARDFICGTLQAAAGMNMHVFTTGRGTPYNLSPVPVIKVSTRSDLARRWHDLIDIDAGTTASGAATFEEMDWALFRLLSRPQAGSVQPAPSASRWPIPWSSSMLCR